MTFALGRSKVKKARLSTLHDGSLLPKELSENFKSPCNLGSFAMHMPLPSKTAEITMTLQSQTDI